MSILSEIKRRKQALDLKAGPRAEELFIDFFDPKHGVKASRSEDMFKHYDVIVELVGGFPLKVDVKGIKNVVINGDNMNMEYAWLEITNNKGYNGWLYGESDAIGFLTHKEWVVVPTDKLQNYYESDIKPTATTVTSPEDGYHNHYTRSAFGNKDLLTMVRWSELKAISLISIEHNYEINRSDDGIYIIRNPNL